MMIQDTSKHSFVMEQMKARLPNAIQSVREDKQSVYFQVYADAAFDFIKILKESPDLGFTFLVDLTAADYSKYSESRPGRFSVVYIILSPVLGVRVVVETYLPEKDPVIRTIVPLFVGANWPEREAYDMFGVRFEGHPDLKRILMPEGYEGHPLRKDYPLKGRGERSHYPVYSAVEGYVDPAANQS